MEENQEKAAAFAAFDLIKADLTALHAHAERLSDQALTATVDEAHANLLSAWTEYLDARGWSEQASTANRSGGEDKTKPPSSGG